MSNELIIKSFIKTITKSQIKNNFKTDLLIVNHTYKEYQKNNSSKWSTVENINEFKEILTDNIGKIIVIISEPDFYEEQNIS